MTAQRHEKPFKRRNPSGKVRWVARITLRNGKRKQTTWGTKAEAQAAIDAAYDREYTEGRAPRQVGTVEAYVAHWERLHPRSERTARAYLSNLRAVMEIEVGGRAFRSWRMDELERSELAELVDHLLRVDERAAGGARGVLRTLSAVWEDAISDGWTRHNPVSGLRVRTNDPRVVKPKRQPNVYSWEQMHDLASYADPMGEAMIRCLSDCGLRLGEMLALERGDVDGDWLWVRRTAYDGKVEAGTKTTRNAPEKARRTPLPPGLQKLLRALPPRLDTRVLFPAKRGRVFQTRQFYRVVWAPAREAAGMPEARPHDFRHSYVSLSRAAGVDPADLAAWTGHTVLTATMAYTHSVGDDADKQRRVVG